MAEKLGNAAPVELPPMVKVSRQYRCQGNSLIFVDFMREADKGYAPDDFKAPSNAKFAMVRGIREAFRPGTEPRVAVDTGIPVLSGPQPYNKVWQNGVTGAPNAGAAVAPPPAPKKPADDITGLY